MHTLSPVIGYIKVSDNYIIYVYKIDSKESMILCGVYQNGVRSKKHWRKLYESDVTTGSKLYFKVYKSAYYIDEMKSIKTKPKLGYLLAEKVACCKECVI